MHRQLPKRRGFKSLSPKAQIVSLKTLSDKFESGATINPKILMNKGLVKSAFDPVKVLGEGEIKKALNFEKIEVSAQAKEKIEKAGGKVAEIKQVETKSA